MSKESDAVAGIARAVTGSVMSTDNQSAQSDALSMLRNYCATRAGRRFHMNPRQDELIRLENTMVLEWVDDGIQVVRSALAQAPTVRAALASPGAMEGAQAKPVNIEAATTLAGVPQSWIAECPHCQRTIHMAAPDWEHPVGLHMEGAQAAQPVAEVIVLNSRIVAFKPCPAGTLLYAHPPIKEQS